MTYAVGDLHGCLNEWLQLRDKIQKKDSKAKFILIGDIIDRGEQVVELCDWAVKHITPNGKYQMIIGNHEHDKILDFNNGIAFLGEEKLSKEWDRTNAGQNEEPVTIDHLSDSHVPCCQK